MNTIECKEMFDGWYIYSNYNSLNEAVLVEGQSILTQEQKDKLINFGTL